MVARHLAVKSKLGAAVAVLLATAFAFGEAASADPRPIRIVAFGDSLTAGYRLAPSAAFPARLEARLKAKGHAVEVLNAGVSGDTTAAGLQRFDWAIPDDTDAVIVELGANDALRGMPVKEARSNLDAILARLSAKGIPALVAGMSAPRNWGEAYVAEFDAMFPDLARKHGAILYPFFLEGVALQAQLNLDDGMHPNDKGVDVIVERILPSVEQLIERARARRLAASKD